MSISSSLEGFSTPQSLNHLTFISSIIWYPLHLWYSRIKPSTERGGMNLSFHPGLTGCAWAYLSALFCELEFVVGCLVALIRRKKSIHSVFWQSECIQPIFYMWTAKKITRSEIWWISFPCHLSKGQGILMEIHLKPLIINKYKLRYISSYTWHIISPFF